MNVYNVFHIIRSRNEKVQLLDMLKEHLALPDVTQYRPGDRVSFRYGGKTITCIVDYLIGDRISAHQVDDPRMRWKLNPADIFEEKEGEAA